jgi:hypothetical protein
LKKRTKKTFANEHARPGAGRNLAKVFWFFFSKKNGFLGDETMPRQAQ